jgi:hypothetical protein
MKIGRYIILPFSTDKFTSLSHDFVLHNYLQGLESCTVLNASVAPQRIVYSPRNSRFYRALIVSTCTVCTLPGLIQNALFLPSLLDLLFYLPTRYLNYILPVQFFFSISFILQFNVINLKKISIRSSTRLDWVGRLSDWACFPR